MRPSDTHFTSEEGALRERLATYFLTAPPIAEQTPAQRQEYLHNLNRLGNWERQEIRQAVGASRPLVWGNPAPLLQSLLSAIQRLAAGMGQPVLIFPARETAIGAETLLHPRLLSVALCDLLCRACTAAPRQPVWVRLQEQRSGLSVAVTATVPFAHPDTLAIIKECTKLHDGSLVHCENTILFSCGQAAEPPTGVRLYGCPTEQDLLQDTVSPVWSVFYAGFYSSTSSSSSMGNSSTLEDSSATGHAGVSSSSSSFLSGEL